MYVDDAIKGIDEEGVVALATVVLPNIIGIGYGNYKSKDEVESNLDEFLKRNMRSDELDKEDYVNYKENGRPINNEEFEQFYKRRDEILKESLTKLFENGKVIIGDDGAAKKVDFKELTPEQVVRATNQLKKDATNQAKEELFGEKPPEQEANEDYQKDLIKEEEQRLGM